MSEISYDGAPVAVREDLPAAHRRAWRRLAEPGTWWTGAERVAIAAEVRNARRCRLCAERKQALAPDATSGEHDTVGALPTAAVEVAHRVSVDNTRLSRTWFEKTLAAGLDDARYVEIIGVVITVVSIDSFCRGIGVPPHPLPEPLAGEPARRRPPGAQLEAAWVPMISFLRAKGAEADLYGGKPTGNVIRALSLVPDEVRGLKDLSAAHYLAPDEMMDLTAGRSLDRAQIELIAGRVSALNECFYWTTSHAVLLRASGEISGNDVDVAAVTDDAAAAGSGIAHAETLLAFAEAAVKGSDAALDSARGRLLDAVGPECLVDAAAVVSNFERMVRIADSTGIPLDAPVTAMSEDLRANLGLNDFHSSANTPNMGALGRFLGRNLRPLARIAFRLISSRARRS